MTLSNPAVDVSQQLATAEYVLPKPPRHSGEVLVLAEPATDATALRRTSEVTRTLGDRFETLAECQRQFLDELRHELLGLDDTVLEGTRVQLQSGVHAALRVLDWCAAAQADFQQQARWAARGWLPVDLGDFCQALAGQVQANGAPVLVTGTAATPWWGDPVALAATIRAGLVVVAERTAGLGTVLIEFGRGEESHQVRIAGTGEPTEDPGEASVRAFRQAVDLLGATVVPDGNGGGGAGLVLRLPIAE